MDNNPKESTAAQDVWACLITIMGLALLWGVALMGHHRPWEVDEPRDHAAPSALEAIHGDVLPSPPEATPRVAVGGEEQSPSQQGSCTALLTQLLEQQTHLLREVQSIREDVRLLVFRAR